MPRWRRRSISRAMRRAARGWEKARADSSPSTAVPPRAWRRGSNRRWRLAAPEGAVDFLDVGLVEAAGRRLQAQRVDEVAVARRLQVAARLEDLLLRVQHVNAGAHAHVAPEDGRVELALGG